MNREHLTVRHTNYKINIPHLKKPQSLLRMLWNSEMTIHQRMMTLTKMMITMSFWKTPSQIDKNHPKERVQVLHMMTTLYIYNPPMLFRKHLKGISRLVRGEEKTIVKDNHPLEQSIILKRTHLTRLIMICHLLIGIWGRSKQ
jgi:hypothetical protein